MLRVLLIEDETDEAKRIGRMLDAAVSPGFELEHAEDLQTGLDKLRSRPFDVLLLDLGSPGSDAIQTVSKAMASAPEVPIITLVASDIAPATLDTLRFGVAHSFVKSSVELEPLIEAIRRQAEGKGRFLPRARDAASSRPPAQPRAKQATVRVLIVEDNPGDVVLIRQLLASVETVSFVISHASMLSPALDEMSRGADVVLLDLNLPDSRDLDTLRRVRAQDAAVPIIVLTGIDDREKAVEALASGANDYFVKERLDAQLLARSILRSAKPAVEP